MFKDATKIFIPGSKMLFIFLSIFAVISAFFNKFVFFGEALVVISLFIFYVRVGLNRKSVLSRYIETMSTHVDAAGKSSILNFPLPMAVIRPSGEIVWYNGHFSDIVGENDMLTESSIFEVIGELSLEAPQADKLQQAMKVSIKEKNFEMYTSKLHENDEQMAVFVLYFIEQTELFELKDEMDRRKSLVGIIMIDNYDEIMQTAREVDRSGASVQIDKIVLEWAEKGGCLIQKFYNDKYILVMEEEYLSTLIEDKFKLLDDVKEILVGPNKMPATLSIGIGRGGKTFYEKLEFSRDAIDLALGRGGDQVVIKNDTRFEFYGGRSKEMEKRTKVKSRVIATALKELILDSRKVFIMGHRYADIDAIGAAIGIYHTAAQLGKEANIVLGARSEAVENLIELMGEPYKNVFITPSQAIDYMEAATLLVVVDTNNPYYVESEELLNKGRTVVVIDHHRRGATYIEKTALSYHEPYASSTCELVTEMLQYLSDTPTLSGEEATAILAGIMLDTKGFMLKTGVRTFEAASFLKRCGADPVEAKGVFSNDLERYRLRSMFVSKAKIYFESIAVAVWDEEGEPGKEILAQAVDEMLSLKGIRAAFGVARADGIIHISARSYGELNVQVTLEKLGGGGHQTMAGVQIETGTLREVFERLLAAIEETVSEEE